MIDTAFLKKIRKMTDSELDRQAGSAYMSAYYESYGRYCGMRKDAGKPGHCIECGIALDESTRSDTMPDEGRDAQRCDSCYLKSWDKVLSGQLTSSRREENYMFAYPVARKQGDKSRQLAQIHNGMFSYVIFEDGSVYEQFGGTWYTAEQVIATAPDCIAQDHQHIQKDLLHAVKKALDESTPHNK